MIEYPNSNEPTLIQKVVLIFSQLMRLFCRRMFSVKIASDSLSSWCIASGIQADKLRLAENERGIRGLYLREGLSAVKGEPVAAIPFDMIISQHTICGTEFGETIDFLWPDTWEADDIEDGLRTEVKTRRESVSAQMNSLCLAVFLWHLSKTRNKWSPWVDQLPLDVKSGYNMTQNELRQALRHLPDYHVETAIEEMHHDIEFVDKVHSILVKLELDITRDELVTCLSWVSSRGNGHTVSDFKTDTKLAREARESLQNIQGSLKLTSLCSPGVATSTHNPSAVMHERAPVTDGLLGLHDESYFVTPLVDMLNHGGPRANVWFMFPHVILPDGWQQFNARAGVDKPDQVHLLLFAGRDIEKGGELFLDYNGEYGNEVRSNDVKPMDPADQVDFLLSYGFIPDNKGGARALLSDPQRARPLSGSPLVPPVTLNAPSNASDRAQSRHRELNSANPEKNIKPKDTITFGGKSKSIKKDANKDAHDARTNSQISARTRDKSNNSKPRSI
jgi:hypothetical protein